MKRLRTNKTTAVLIAASILLQISLPASGQKESEAAKRNIPNLPNFDQQRLHFGFLVGLNFLDYHVDNTGLATEANAYIPRYADVVNLTPGLNLAMVTDLRLHENLNLRALPGISFGQRELTYTPNLLIATPEALAAASGNARLDMETVKIRTTYLDLPILLKFSAFRINNIKPYIVGGSTMRYDLARDKHSHLKTSSFDVFVDGGTGFDFYLPYFRLSIELRASIGMLNTYAKQQPPNVESYPYQQTLSGLHSRWYGLSFYFE